MPISDFYWLMPHTITYRPAIAVSTYGVIAYGAPATYRARVTYRAIRTANKFTGQDEVAAGTVWIGAAVTAEEGSLYGDPLFSDPDGIGRNPNKDDQITLPDGSTPNIIDWQLISNEKGLHHTKVIFGGTEMRTQK